ncbi:alpha/beta hydrolase [Bradyrhizobium sp. RT3a]|uniref:alpha/beta hydrolase n=1 Tax=unclassified Bradyrhizobium TaxID=2631580 RepID=UPI003397370B
MPTTVARYNVTALIVICAIVLGGCARRPGPWVLEPVPSVGAAKLVKVFVASTRAAQPEASVPLAEGGAPTPAYFRYVISIPPNHAPTEIEWPTNAPDPASHFSVVSAERLDEERFLLEIGQAAARGDSLGRDVGIFVHGYNNSFQESLFRTAQLVADSGAGRSAVLFSWPSKAELTGYIADKDAVTLSRDALAHLVTRLGAERGVRGVKLVAHSMGSWLTMEVVRQIRIASDVRTIEKLNDVTLAAPDIDTEVFLQQLRVIGRLRSPITVLVSKEDQALSFSRFLAGGQLRAGAADIDDPRVISGARTANVRVIDISGLATSAGAGHDGFTAYSAIYGRLQTSRDGLNASEISAGVYALDVADRLRPLDARLEQRAAVP